MQVFNDKKYGPAASVGTQPVFQHPEDFFSFAQGGKFQGRKPGVSRQGQKGGKEWHHIW